MVITEILRERTNSCISRNMLMHEINLTFPVEYFNSSRKVGYSYMAEWILLKQQEQEQKTTATSNPLHDETEGSGLPIT